MTSELALDANPPTRPPAPQQQEMPLAVVHGQPVLQIPQDLYIPPDALEVILGVSLATLCNFANVFARTPLNPELAQYRWEKPAN